jgi:hypothetical protein
VYATSQLSGNTSSVLYTVPPFILGLPKLDMEDCIVYLVWQLRQAKFEVRFTWPNFLYISWRHHEADYLTRQNPIIKAMMPEPMANPKAVGAKKKGPNQAPVPAGRPAVAFNNEIDIINMPQATPFSPGQGPQHRRAIDYEPPPSFIQNMERPGPGRQMQSGRDQMQSGRDQMQSGRDQMQSGRDQMDSARGQMQGQGYNREMQTGAKGNVLADLWSI